jgi:hypothetical protein
LPDSQTHGIDAVDLRLQRLVEEGFALNDGLGGGDEARVEAVQGLADASQRLLVGNGEAEAIQLRQGGLGIGKCARGEVSPLRILRGEEAPVHDAEEEQGALDLHGLGDHRILAGGPQLGDEGAGGMGQFVPVHVDAGSILPDL